MKGLNYADILAQPLQLGSRTISNRIVMPAMGTGLAGVNGEVTPQLLRYYEDRARGGPGAIVVEITCVDSPLGKASLTQLCIDRSGLLPGLADLADTIKSYGSLAFVQLHHAGRQTSPFVMGTQPVAPSPKACRFMRAEPRQLNIEEIEGIRNKFIKAAVLASRAGFDGVELHAAHGYLLSQFLSPYTNLRNDQYGGNLENRFRLLGEIITGIKHKAPQLLLLVRFNMMDFVDGGIAFDEGLQIARLIADCGADCLDASCGIYESGQTTIETGSFQEGWRMDMISQVKQNVNIPVLGGGVIRTPQLAAQMIEQGAADLIWVGRGMLADPDWARKALQGKSDQIRPCITCNTCFETINKGHHIRCAVNPHVGREERMARSVSLNDYTVMVAGGGPAGLQAALSFVQAGSKVVLAEAADQLGGQMKAAQVPPGKSRIGRLQQYLVDQVQASSADIRLSTKLCGELIREVDPDVLVIAAGSVPGLPDIPGIKGLANVYTAAHVLEQSCSWQEANVIIIGGGSTGCEVADYLSARNKVTIIEKEKQLAADMENMSRLEILYRLKKSGVVMKKSYLVEEVSRDKISIRQLENGDTEDLPYDYLVLAAGNRPVSIELDKEELPDLVYVIGDAKWPRGFAEAIYEGEMCVHRLSGRN